MPTHRSFSKTLLAGLMAASLLLPQGSRADDIDIYINQATLPQQQPLTFLALDLNVSNPNSVVCDNVLIGTTQNCLDLASRISLNDLLGSLGIPMVGNLAGAPALPLVDPNKPISDLNGAEKLLVGTYLDTLTTFVNNLPGRPPITNPASVTQQGTYLLAIIDLITAFAASRAQLSILLNHDDIGGVTRDPTTTLVNGTTPAAGCAFNDTSSLGGERVGTTGCSNGAYVFNSLADLGNPAQLQATILRLANTVLPLSSVSVDPANPTVPAAPNPQVLSGLSAQHPYQAKEIYAELARYLRGDPVFNGHLGYYDYGDRTASNNVNQTSPPLAWDTTAEVDNKYRSVLAANPQACTINLVHVQSTNAARQEESNAQLATLFPLADEDRSGNVSLPELASDAAIDGVAYGRERKLINSLFVVQQSLSDANTLTQRGESVVGFSDALNLLGRGQDIAAALVKSLAVDTTLGSITTAVSRSSKIGTTDAAYLPIFRPEKNQKPAWYGNVKRLKLRPNGKSFTVVDSRDTGTGDAVKAIAEDGRIRPGALTLWTDSSQLGTGVSNDGRKADLGGAGQKIPGFAFGGGGNPGRGAAGSARTVYYDSTPSGSAAALVLLNADDSGVRSELLAATGATAVTLPDANCATNCQTAKDARDLVCNNPNSFTSTCNAENTACTASCNGGNYTTVCNNEQASCLATCAPGLPGAVCRANCNTTRTSCPTTKTAQCNATCPAQLAACPASKQAMCLTDSAAQDTTCRVACVNTRTADTLVRELLLHARGFDVGTRTSPKGTGPATSPTNSGVTSRPWLMGAVLHSKPLAINYGKRGGASSDDIRVVFGSADGMMHMVNDSTGTENWGFMPQAAMGALATLRDNQSGSSLPYGVDGAPVVLIRDKAPTNGKTGVIGDVTGTDGDRVLLFFGLRRGGSAYYALDITDPDSPKLQWRLSTEGLRRGGDTAVVANTAAQFASLGLTFSTPQIARIRRDADGEVTTDNNDVRTVSALVFGGGYNGGRDGSGSRIGKDLNNSRALTPTPQVGRDDGSGSSDRGNSLFMVDAATGELLWRAVRGSSLGGYTLANRSYTQPMLLDSIPSDLTVLDTDNDGFSDRLYVGDTGGRLWRADFASTLPSAWSFGPLASIGRHSVTPVTSVTVADDRRIFAAPDYVPVRGAAGSGRDLVLFGTGDREDVLNLSTVNWLYGYIDRDLVSGKAATAIITAETDTRLAKPTNFGDATDTPLSNLDGQTAGYRLRFTRKGEKMFSTPVTLDGTVTFSTYIPPDPSNPDTPICVPSEGSSRLYSIGVQTTEKRGINGATATDRDTGLAKPGLPGEVSVLAGTAQSVGGEVYSNKARDYYRASWRERLGETQK